MLLKMYWILCMNLLFNLVTGKALARSTPHNTDEPLSNEDGNKNSYGSATFTNQHVPNLTAFKGEKWPWQVAIFILLDWKFEFRCGGTLIDSDIVLTAAHCLKNPDVMPSEIRIAAGDYDLTIDDGDEQVRYVSKIIIHPNYTGKLSSLYSDDLALVKLAEAVVITNHTCTLVLSQTDVGEDVTSCLITGWGIADQVSRSEDTMPTELSHANVDILTNDVCNEVRNWDGLVKQSQMCAYSAEKSACLGDSGGPLICKVNKQHVQFGVTSWGSRSCDRKPSVYTRISFYYTWISEAKTEIKA